MEARSAYGEKARYVDVQKNPSELQVMLKYSRGSRQVPVIVEGNKVTIGYGGS
jgi:glutaredoxin 3